MAARRSRRSSRTKPQGLDDIHRDVEAGGEPQQRAGILRNIRLKKRETHMTITGCGRRANLCKAQWIELYPCSRHWRHIADAVLREYSMA